MDKKFIKEYYNTNWYGAPDFESLTNEQLKVIYNSYGFKVWWFNKAIKDLKSSVKKSFSFIEKFIKTKEL
jgi:hypothetical protein